MNTSSVGLDALWVFNKLNKEEWRNVNHYLLNKEDAAEIESKLLENWFSKLEIDNIQSFDISTQYYDFPGDMFLSNGVKLRLRSYPNGSHAVEWKITNRNWLLKKERITSMEEPDAKIWLPENHGNILVPFQKSIKTKYTRKSFIFHQGDEILKITIDTGLEIKNTSNHKTKSLWNLAIVEVKSFNKESLGDNILKKIWLIPDNRFSKTDFSLGITSPTSVSEETVDYANDILKKYGT